MQSLRDLESEDIYQDGPDFCDAFLIPALDAGHSITLVTAFTPSYLVRLVGELRRLPKRSVGTLKVVFCIPIINETGMTKGRLFSKYLCAYAKKSSEVKVFLEDIKFLSSQGKLQLSGLISNSAQMLTPSCLGIVESGEYSSQDMLTFVDLLAEDSNSPISIESSWQDERKDFLEIQSLVSKALFYNFANILRISSSEIAIMIDEILQKGYPKKDVADDTQDPSKPASQSAGTPESAIRPRVRKIYPTKPRETIGIEDEDDDDFDDLELAEQLRDEEIESMLNEVSYREREYYSESLDEFLGGSLESSFFDSESNKSHAGPMSEDLAELFGHTTSVCWCGEEYDTSQGCSQYLY